jgi:hypothetical protein
VNDILIKKQNFKCPKCREEITGIIHLNKRYTLDGVTHIYKSRMRENGTIDYSISEYGDSDFKCSKCNNDITDFVKRYANCQDEKYFDSMQFIGNVKAISELLETIL